MITDWDSAATALGLLAQNPKGLGGIVIRMRAGPDRDIVTAALRNAFPDMRRVSPSIDDIHLFGGVDISATLSSGQVIFTDGLLRKSRVLCLTMAERCSAALAARLGQYLDAHPDAIIIALDEGAEENETVPTSLSERLAFAIAPTGHPPKGWNIATKSNRLNIDHFDFEQAQCSLVSAAAAFGIASMRAPAMAAQAAKGLARSTEVGALCEDLIAQAAALVFSHRATRVPSENVDEEDPPSSQDEDLEGGSDANGERQDTVLPDEMILAAVKATLPPEILAGLGKLGSNTAGFGTGAGRKKKGNRRGRPLPSRPGPLDGRNRLDILATLRAAAPWQPIRRRVSPDRTGLLLRPSDFRVKRYETKSDRLIIFAVDASGSAAISRLNEAKGAVELLLGQAYAARDHVALVAFRKDRAECLLRPTRSLVQTKRKLGALPGGGATPLAAGLSEAMEIAIQARSRGMSPVIALLTDGKTNIALDGTADRARAKEDAVKLAYAIQGQGIETLVIDMAARPQPALRDLSQHLDGTYLPMPRANAEGLSGAVQAAMDRA